ncbi:MAG: hypothetical protein JO358_21390 [Alphaproteobacteria bacterium]|nr:hypothetical protein [Alphaproteobacteria bacterium]
MPRNGPETQAGKKIERADKHNQRRRKAKETSEVLSPERRRELAQQIEAKRFRGKPPSI